MIRINLITRTRGSGRPKKRRISRILWWGVAVCICALIAGIGYRYLPVQDIANRLVGLFSRPEESASSEQVHRLGDYGPSSMKNPSAVEEVVKDTRRDAEPINDSGLLALEYSEFSFHEKVCYEHLFARRILSYISRITPSQVEMERLELHDFQRVNSSGYAGRKEWVARMFSTLKTSDAVELAKPPHSYIRKASGVAGYAYRFRANVQWGLDLQNQAVDLSLADCLYKDNEEIVTDRFSKIAQKTNLVFLHGPDLQSTSRHGEFYRNVYRFSAIGRFSDLAVFVKQMQEYRWYCAFSELVITARGNGKVHVDAEVVVTLRK